MRFCGECGNPTVLDAHFCGNCGAPTDEAHSGLTAAPEPSEMDTVLPTGPASHTVDASHMEASVDARAMDADEAELASEPRGPSDGADSGASAIDPILRTTYRPVSVPTPGRAELAGPEAVSPPATEHICSACRAENEPDAVYCGECGAALAVGRPQADSESAVSGACATCGSAIQAGDRFCDTCGAPAPVTAHAPLCPTCGQVWPAS